MPIAKSSAVGAGKGLLFITGAKLWFMVAGYVVQFALPRALGSAASYGIWVLVLGAAVAFHSAIASVGGFVAASVLILTIAFLVVGLGGQTREPFPAHRLWAFFAGVAVYLLIINLLMFVDGLLLKRLVAESAM